MAAADDRFLDQLRFGLEQCAVRGQRIVLAVSGGADSTALLYGLHALRHEFAVEIHAAHLNHQLRDEADDDADWIARLCGRLSVPVCIEARGVAERASGSGRSLEEAARHERYSFLAHVAVRCGARRIAVAHTADDQSETILHHLLRGTGLKGLAGMPLSRELADGVRLVRPLLQASRRDVLDYLNSLGAAYRDDVSNADPRFTRNRLRHELLPLLRTTYNPQIDAILQRLGEQAAAAQELVETFAADALETSLLESQRESCRLDRTRLRELPRHLLRACFHRLWVRMAWPRQRMGFREWDRLADLAVNTAADARITLPGPVRAETRGALLHLQRVEPSR